MEQLQRIRAGHNPRRRSQLVQRLCLALLIALAGLQLLRVIRANILGMEIPPSLMATVAVAFVATLVGTFFLVRALREYRESQERFQPMATNIGEILLDDRHAEQTAAGLAPVVSVSSKNSRQLSRAAVLEDAWYRLSLAYSFWRNAEWRNQGIRDLDPIEQGSSESRKRHSAITNNACVK